MIGTVTSGAKCIKAWTDVAKKAYQKHNYIELRSSFAPQDPAAAFEAIEVLLKREIAAKTATAGVATASFGGKLVGTFVDGGTVSGPVMGMIDAIASIIQTVVEISIELTEMKKANELLRLGALNIDLFKVCPILGCYFLNVQDHSTIINYAVGDYGKDNFVFDAERLVKKIEPVLDRNFSR